jgi:hypothetical protein
VNSLSHFCIPSFPGVTPASVSLLWTDAAGSKQLNRCFFFNGYYTDALATGPQGFIHNLTFRNCEQGIIGPDHHVQAGFDACSALTDQDIARHNALTGVFFNAQPLPIAVATVPD